MFSFPLTLIGSAESIQLWEYKVDYFVVYKSAALLDCAAVTYFTSQHTVVHLSCTFKYIVHHSWVVVHKPEGTQLDCQKVNRI